MQSSVKNHVHTSQHRNPAVGILWGAGLWRAWCVGVCVGLLTLWAVGRVGAEELAPPLTLAWDATPDTSVSYYFVYRGTSSREYYSRLKITGAPRCRMDDLVQGQRYFFTVTAVSADGTESDYSAEISYFSKPSMKVFLHDDPARLAVTFPTVPNLHYIVYRSEDLAEWSIDRVILGTGRLFFFFVHPDREPPALYFRVEAREEDDVPLE